MENRKIKYRLLDSDEIVIAGDQLDVINTGLDDGGWSGPFLETDYAVGKKVRDCQYWVEPIRFRRIELSPEAIKTTCPEERKLLKSLMLIALFIAVLIMVIFCEVLNGRM